METAQNRFKQGLLQHRVQCGLWLGLASAYAAEVCAAAGFDWVVVDGEHAPNDLRSILRHLQALAPYETHPIVRPVSGDVHAIKQLLDIGAQTLLVPMVDTAEQAAKLVSAMRYPPRGVRGVGSALARASRWNSIPSYLSHAEENLCLVVQVESRRGVENVESIAAVDGVDGVFIGPSDLAASYDHLGNPRAPEVEAAIASCIQRVQAAGKAVGILTTDRAMSLNYVSMGCTFVAIGLDVALLLQSARALASSFHER